MPELQDLTLVVPEKPDPERDAVAAAWLLDEGQVVRVARFWDPPPLDPAKVRLYGPDTFCLVLAQRLRLALVSPPDDVLLRLEPRSLQRSIRGVRLEEIHTLEYPAFAKSAVPQLFRADVYTSADELRDATRGLEPDTLVLISEIVIFDSEVRCWVLDGEIVTLGGYEGEAQLDAAHDFARSVARHPVLPATYVLDIGVVHNRGWAVIEASAAWGANLNGCDPKAAARCVARACHVE